MREIAEALRKNGSLAELYFRSDEIDEEGRVCLEAAARPGLQITYY